MVCDVCCIVVFQIFSDGIDGCQSVPGDSDGPGP